MSLRILMAEDDPDIQLVARLVLKKAGFTVDVVGNGQLLLEKVREVRPDLILLDWMMPELDGPATCTRLKADPETRDIPVAFLTARKSSTSEPDQAAALGAVGYIAKPFNPLTLASEVQRLMDR
jgi:CheY-like chemotaxis protein